MHEYRTATQEPTPDEPVEQILRLALVVVSVSSVTLVRRSALVAFVLGVLAGGCGRRAATGSADCAAMFGPPPGADRLCDERSMGNSAEIHWRS